jgi:hypothetical protein
MLFLLLLSEIRNKVYALLYKHDEGLHIIKLRENLGKLTLH